MKNEPQYKFLDCKNILPLPFDFGILEDAYKATKHQIPWNFRLERDVRTLVAFYPAIKRDAQSVGVMHAPIDDCKFQIQYCCAIWRKLFPNVS